MEAQYMYGFGTEWITPLISYRVRSLVVSDLGISAIAK